MARTWLQLRQPEQAGSFIPNRENHRNQRNPLAEKERKRSKASMPNGRSGPGFRVWTGKAPIRISLWLVIPSLRSVCGLLRSSLPSTERRCTIARPLVQLLGGALPGATRDGMTGLCPTQLLCGRSMVSLPFITRLAPNGLLEAFAAVLVCTPLRARSGSATTTKLSYPGEE